MASLCRERLHVLLQEELMRLGWARDERENVRVGIEDGWTVVMKRAFDRMDQLALTTCGCGATGFACGCHPVTVALSGSTATVAVVTADHIIAANCGDSRAVLCRGRRVLPLTFDHKPDRPDELARIEAAGGRVIFLKGARVQGILAMSRAIGDKFLKPLVISEPDITITRRDAADECLILASDGLWDVIPSELACKVACQCLREGSHAPASGVVPSTERDGVGPMSAYPSQSALAAALLTRLALGRESSDNISVIVVDLKSR